MPGGKCWRSAGSLGGMRLLVSIHTWCPQLGLLLGKEILLVAQSGNEPLTDVGNAHPEFSLRCQMARVQKNILLGIPLSIRL